MRARLRVAVLAAAVVAIASCGPAPDPRTTAPSACAKLPVHIVLHFDSTHMWGMDLDRDVTVAVTPRADSRWRFDPGPPTRLIDDAVQVVAHDGDIFYAACLDPVTYAYVIGPEDLPNQAPGA